MDKKLKSILIVSFLLMLICMPLVLGARRKVIEPVSTWENMKPYFWGAVNWVFGYEVSFTWVLIYILLFVMISFAFRDMIQIFSMFSDTTSWVLGIGLGGIVALTGILSKLVVFVFGAIALYGAVIVAVVLVLAFTMFLLAHLFFFDIFLRMRTRKEIGKAKTEAGEVAAGWAKLREFMKRTKK